MYYSTQKQVNYGKIVLTLGELMDKREITRHKLAKLAYTDYSVADKYYKGNVERLDLDLLARICFVLNCSVSDVLRYEPPSDSTES